MTESDTSILCTTQILCLHFLATADPVTLSFNFLIRPHCLLLTLIPRQSCCWANISVGADPDNWIVSGWLGNMVNKRSNGRSAGTLEIDEWATGGFSRAVRRRDVETEMAKQPQGREMISELERPVNKQIKCECRCSGLQCGCGRQQGRHNKTWGM